MPSLTASASTTSNDPMMIWLTSVSPALLRRSESVKMMTAPTTGPIQ